MLSRDGDLITLYLVAYPGQHLGRLVCSYHLLRLIALQERRDVQPIRGVVLSSSHLEMVLDLKREWIWNDRYKLTRACLCPESGKDEFYDSLPACGSSLQ